MAPKGVWDVASRQEVSAADRCQSSCFAGGDRLDFASVVVCRHARSSREHMETAHAGSRGSVLGHLRSHDTDRPIPRHTKDYQESFSRASGTGKNLPGLYENARQMACAAAAEGCDGTPFADGAGIGRSVSDCRFHGLRRRRQPSANAADTIEPTGVFRTTKTQTQHEEEIEAGQITIGTQTENTSRPTQKNEETIRCGDQEENRHDANLDDAVMARRHGLAVVLAKRRFEFERAPSPIGHAEGNAEKLFNDSRCGVCGIRILEDAS